VRPNGAVDVCSMAHLSKHGLVAPLCRPVGAGPFWAGNPGLKPRAESSCPFGAKCDPHPVDSGPFAIPQLFLSAIFPAQAVASPW
jgi:hypothetical protein